MFVRKCIVKTCDDRTNIFAIPSNKDVRRIWLKRCGHQDVKEDKNLKVCPKHFGKACFRKGGKGLLRFAVPSLDLPNYTITGGEIDDFVFPQKEPLGTPDRSCLVFGSNIIPLPDARLEPSTYLHCTSIGDVKTPTKTYTRQSKEDNKIQVALTSISEMPTIIEPSQVSSQAMTSTEQKDAYVESAIDETKPTLGLDDDLQNEVATTFDLCGDSLELNKICICCLKVTEVFTLGKSFVGNVSVLTLYKAISDIEVNEKEVPAMICQKCMRLLSRIDEFVKMLNHSHKVLLEAANLINSLKTLENDPETFNLKKNEIIHKALKEERLIPLDDDMFQYIRRRPQTETDTSKKLEVEKFSSNSLNGIQRFQKKRVCRSDVLPKQGTKRINNVSVTTSEEISIEDKIPCRDYCPFCCKRVRFFARHSRHVHSVDWFTFRCLKCFFHHKLPDKLIEHCKSCGITIKQEPEVTISEALDPLETDLNCYVKSENETEVGPTLVTGDETWLTDQKKENGNGNFLINTKEKKFNCHKCKDFSTTEFDEVEEHVLNVHYNEKECILCMRHYTRFYAMVYHIKTAHGNRKCCKLCLINFKNDQEAEDHYKSEAHCTCQVCGRQFQNRRQLYRHWHIHNSTIKKRAGPFKCPECSREYSTRDGVYKHIAVFHKNIRYLCDTCGQSYSTRRTLRLHNQSVHEGIRHKWIPKIHLCETCGEDLSTNSRYKVEVHKANHAGNNFVCRRCYASFATKDLHDQHINELNHRLFECQICGATFVLPDAFRLHVEKNHATSQRTGSINTLKTMKGWPCRYCSKILKTKRTLQNHEKIHTGERPYQCAECDQAFIKLINMKKHRALHYRPEGIV